MKSRNMKYKQSPTPKEVRSWNLCPRAYWIICCWTSFLMMSFEDLNLIFYIEYFDRRIEVIMKINPQFKQYFVTNFMPLTQTNMILIKLEHYFGPLFHACTQLWHIYNMFFFTISFECTFSLASKISILKLSRAMM